MKRDLTNLADEPFDVLVIGAGILGSCVAWDAALRGLSVALIERDDFAGAASANSLKIIHGGLRYLQHLDFARMRESIRERSFWLKAAPHLVEPLPVLVPTYRTGSQRRALLSVASSMNDAVSWDRNRGLSRDRNLPSGRTVSKAHVMGAVPELDSASVTGGLLFHDALMYSSEHLVLEVVQAAHQAGAVVANYVAFESPLPASGRTIGARVVDVLDGQSFEVRARSIVNAAGGAAGEVARRLTGRQEALPVSQCVAVNIMIPSRGHDLAFSLRGSVSGPKSERGSRQYFAVPWRERLMIGTEYYETTEQDPAISTSSHAIEKLVQRIDAMAPGLALDPSQVVLVHAGRLPVLPGSKPPARRLLKRHLVVDHRKHGTPNILSVVTAKYTTARRAAQDVVDRLADRTGEGLPACRTASTPLPGAVGSGTIEDLTSEAEARFAVDLDRDVIRHLVRTYGSTYDRVVGNYRVEVGWNRRVRSKDPVIKAQWIRAIREEMAQRPEDLVCRRTELGARGSTDRELFGEAETLLKASRAEV